MFIGGIANAGNAAIMMATKPLTSAGYRWGGFFIFIPRGSCMLPEAAGGRWNPEEKIWRVMFGIRNDAELVERIMRE
jgi:hypothetical protein